MIPYDPDKLLFGIHIPKCAGTSMQQLMRRWFGCQVHWHYFDARRNRMPQPFRPTWFLRLARRISGSGYCVFGHFNCARGFGIADYYPDAQQFFTIVRDPLATVLSRYFFGKRLGDWRIRGGKPVPIATLYASVDEFVAAQIQQPYFTNYLPGPMTLDNYTAIFETQFVYVGIAEDLQTSVDQLARRMGFASITVPHVNVSGHDETLDPALAAAFKRSRPLEYAIYHYALEYYRDYRSA